VSNINYASINENFPVAGEDNDTQVFRDNFDTIKTSLRYAKEELEVLQDSATGAARLNAANDFNGNELTNAKLVANVDKVFNAGNWNVATCQVDYLNGNYQIFRFGTAGGAVAMDFVNLPVNEVTPGVGKITLELYTDGTPQTISFTVTGSLAYKRNGFTTISLSSSSDRRILEVWRHSSGIIFINNVGLFT
jgi:hypothetical protein